MKKLLAHLSTRQRISIVVVAVLVVAGLYALVQHQHEADFRPLFTGLAADDAAAIVQKLKESGVDYRLPEGGGAVLVPSARLPELRLAMAAAGLPKTGRAGFELFDKTNLGADEFTEQVNYRRALEGELERSVMSLAGVEQARVHITPARESVYLEGRQPAKASVLVRLRPGASLAPQNVQAIDHLVASAVEGLAPNAVSVLDMNGNLLGRPRPAAGPDGGEPSEAALDYRRKVEADLLAKINSTLDPLLGPNRFRAGVSVDCDLTDGEQSEEVLDPTRSVMTTSQRTEDSTGVAATSGIPGTASALPRPSSRPSSSGANRISRTTENIAYETSRTIRKMRLPAGAIKRMSLAVLVDQDVTWARGAPSGPTGYRRVLVPPAPDKLKAIRDLVAGITGVDEKRGDQLVVETLPFETTLLLEPPAAPPVQKPAPNGSPKWDRNTLLVGGAAVFGLVLLVFGAARLLRRAPARGPVEVTGPAALPQAEGGQASEASNPLAKEFESQLAERDARQQRLEAQALDALKLQPVITKTGEVLAKHLREKIKQDPEMNAQVLRTWIRDEES